MADNRMSLLAMVQDILSDMNSDSVNTISDTAESLQVAQIIKSTYFFLLSQMDRPWLGQLTQLESAVVATPTKMKIPVDVSKILWIKYDTRIDAIKNFTDITYKTPKEFMDYIYMRNSSASNVTTITDNSVVLLIQTDKAPQYWTSFDDEYVWFDSYDSDMDSTLHTAKTVVHAYKEPTWESADTFVPDMPSHLFPWFLTEAKSTCMVRLKQTTDPKAEQQARAGKTRNQHSQWRQNGKDQGPNFGRK